MAGREEVIRQADALAGAGKLREAAELLERTVSLEGRWAEGALALARMYGRLGRIEDGVAACRRAVVFRPDLPAGQGLLGDLLLAQGRAGLAAEAYRAAYRLDAGNAAWVRGLGRGLAEQGKLAEAREAFERAVRMVPVWAEAWVDLGRTLEDLNELEGAKAAYIRATRLAERFGAAWHRLGVVEGKQGRLELAAEFIGKAVELEPGNAAAQFDLGVAWERRGRMDEAGAAFERALSLRPGDAGIMDALGRSLGNRGRLDEAVAMYRRGLQADPRHVGCHGWLGLALLLMGQWEEGWREYEWRWKSPTFPTVRYPGPEPDWHGEDLARKRIMVYTEQGYGDAIQFARYLRLVAGRGGRVVVVAQRELARLMGCVEGVERVVVRGESLGAFEVNAALLSLPGVFRTRVHNVPAGTGYIKVPGEVRELWRQRVAERMGGGTELKVGLVWAGRPEHGRDRERSYPLELFARLGRVAGVRLASLQMGEAANELGQSGAAGADSRVGARVVDMMGGVGDFLDTAGVLLEMDLVIGVDTAVVHLAGALGKEVWTIVQAVPDWRWLREGERTVWYPTMRLIRLRLGERKEEVMERVAGALEEWVKSRRA